MIDWKPGDHAQCIRDTDSFGRNIGVQLMNVYTVSNVMIEEGLCGNCNEIHSTIGLQFVEVKPRGGFVGWDHQFFRKVDPTILDEDTEEKKQTPIKEPELA